MRSVNLACKEMDLYIKSPQPDIIEFIAVKEDGKAMHFETRLPELVRAKIDDARTLLRQDRVFEACTRLSNPDCLVFTCDTYSQGTLVLKLIEDQITITLSLTPPDQNKLIELEFLFVYKRSKERLYKTTFTLNKDQYEALLNVLWESFPIVVMYA